MRILIGGDFSPTKANFDLFERGDSETLYGQELLNYLADFDYRVFDFEAAFDGAGAPVQKYGPLITTPPACLPGIEAINPDLFVLANNHAANLGSEGIEHTKTLLKEHGISSMGAGSNLTEARKPFYLTKGDLTIGFYACAEHEFNAAGENTAGVNPYDPLVTFDEVREAKRHCDQLVVFYHGGMIEYRYPLPGERRALRKLVDCGADLVVGQHTHTIGCAETYRGKTIIYGQGDFFFARPTRNEHRFSGLLIEVEASKDALAVSYNVRVKPEDTIRLATPEEKERVLDAFETRSAEIQDEQRFAEIYRQNLKERRITYLNPLLGRSRRNPFWFALNMLTGQRFKSVMLRSHFAKLDWLILDNWLSCETHREFFSDLIVHEWQGRQ